MPLIAARRLTSLTIAAALLIAVVPMSASADTQDAVALGITPMENDGSWFDLEAEPGEELVLAVELANHGSSPVEARTFAADVYSLLNGGMGVGLHDEPAEAEATGWIEFSAEDIVLEPDTRIRHDFTVSVPDDAAPGEYIAALVLQHEIDAAETGGDVVINQVSRQAVAVNITVPGPAAADVALGDTDHSITAGRSTTRTELDNAGNRHLGLDGDVEITDADGATVVERELDLAIVYAGTSTHVEVVLDELLAEGDYTITTTLADESHEVSATNTSTFEVIAPPEQSSAIPGADRVIDALNDTGHPVLVLTLFAAVLVLMVALAVVVIRGRSRRVASHDDPPPTSDQGVPAGDPAPLAPIGNPPATALREAPIGGRGPDAPRVVTGSVSVPTPAEPPRTPPAAEPSRTPPAGEPRRSSGPAPDVRRSSVAPPAAGSRPRHRASTSLIAGAAGAGALWLLRNSDRRAKDRGAPTGGRAAGRTRGRR